MSALSSSLPRRLYTASAVRELDRRAMDSGIPGIELMRRAAEFALDTLTQRWPSAKRLLIWTGAGNNAGDGYLLAKLALARGLAARVVAVSDPDGLRGDAAVAYAQAAAAGVEISTEAGEIVSQRDCVWVDALLGIGLSRELDPRFRGAVDSINAGTAPVLSLDIPSGLCADTGAVLGAAVIADATTTFVAMKRGLLTAHGCDLTGEILFCDLGIPAALSAGLEPAAVTRVDCFSPACALPPRANNSHKGSHGHVVVVGGDHGYGGACVLAAEAALHSGAGLVSVVTRSAHRAGILARRPELMVVGSEDAPSGKQDGGDHPGWREAVSALLMRASAIVLGPGLGRGEWGRQLCLMVMAAAKARSTPLLIDADALFFLSDEPAGPGGKTLFPPGAAGEGLRPWVITPHPGEAALLLDLPIAEVQRDRFASVQALARRYRSQALLKGAGSVMCADGDRLLLCTEGNPGMATGGMGDVLSGLIGGLLAQGLDPATSLEVGVCLHGEAGDLAAQRVGQRGLMASELLPEIRRLLN